MPCHDHELMGRILVYDLAERQKVFLQNGFLRYIHNRLVRMRISLAPAHAGEMFNGKQDAAVP